MTEMSDERLMHLLDVPYEFVGRPRVLPAQLRASLRIPLVLLIADKCHGGRASTKTMHVLSWALRSQEGERAFAQAREGAARPDRPVVRFEPALDRALDLAAGLRLLERAGNGTFKLTAAGRGAVRSLKRSGALEVERAFLDRLPGKITQGQVDAIVEWSRS